MRERALRGRVLLAAVAITWALVIAVFTVAALMVPVPRPAGVAAPQIAPAGPSAPLRELPVIASAGVVARLVADDTTFTSLATMDAALRAAWVDAFGRGDADEFMGLVHVPEGYHSKVIVDEENWAKYPFVLPELEAFFQRALPAAWTPQQAERASDLAALLMLTSVNQREGFEKAYSDNGSLAYVILATVAKRSSGCDASLNLALLVSMDYNAPDVAGLSSEFDRATSRCPHDPTPRWLLGQFLTGTGQYAPAAANAAALRSAFPGSPWGYASEADTYLAEGARLAARQPFTARERFRRALDLYRAAQRVSGDPGLAAAEAVALTGLADLTAAAATINAAAAKSASLIPWQVDILERAGGFAEAAAAIAGRAGDPHPHRVLVGRHVEVLLPEEWEPVALLSVGAERLRPAEMGVGGGCNGCGAGSYQAEVSIIPRYANGGDVGYCATCNLVERDTLVAHGPDVVQERIAAVATGEGSGYATLAGLAAGKLKGTTEQYAQLQNLLRFARRYDRAAAVAEQWATATPDDPVPYQMRGEIAYLASDYPLAESWLNRALAHAYDMKTAPDPPECPAGCRPAVQLRLGLIKLRLGKTGEAVDALTAARDGVAAMADEHDAFPEFTRSDVYETFVFALSQLGLAQAMRHDYAASASTYARLEAFAVHGKAFDDGYRLPSDYRPGSDLNNAALSLLKSGRAGDAVRKADQAIATDPANPVYTVTLAWAYQEQEDWDSAARAYGKALEADPSFFPAANDRAVILARSGHLPEAIDLLRQTVAAQPEYALGWFNLGVALRRQGAGGFLASENAFSHAVALDGSLRNHDTDFAFDLDPYVVEVNSAELLPATWSFAGQAQRRPLALSLLLILAVAARLVWQLVSDHAQGNAAERVLKAGGRLRRRFRIPALAGVVATVALVAWSSSQEPAPWIGAVTAAVAATGFLALASVSRRAVAVPAGTRVREFTWLPALVVSAAIGWYTAVVFPVPAATAAAPPPTPPPPAPANPARPGRLHLAAPIAVGAVVVVLLMAGRFTNLPLLRGWASLALGFAGSLLIPVTPLDGAFIASKWLQYAVSIGMIALAVAMFLGVL